ncbi:MAG: hypothetical protein KFH98_12515, partial [Gemmatimonadetes bacterium]|nr:hypothetical protein [Gemmatimonadota bacterium]
TITSDSTSIAANGISSAIVTVMVFDANDNLLGRSAGVVSLATTVGILDGVTDHNDGTYTARLRADTLSDLAKTDGSMAGGTMVVDESMDTAVVTGTLNGDSIPDTARVELRHESADPATTTIAVDPDSVRVGIGETLVMVTLRDAAGNRVLSGRSTVRLSTTQGKLTDVVNHGDGTYTAWLRTVAAAGTVVVTGEVDGVPIADQAEVEVHLPN